MAAQMSAYDAKRTKCFSQRQHVAAAVHAKKVRRYVVGQRH